MDERKYTKKKKKKKRFEIKLIIKLCNSHHYNKIHKNIIIQKKRLDNMWGGSIFHNCHIHLTWSLTPSLERGNPSLFDNVLSCVNDMVLNIIGLLKSNIFIK